MNQQLIGNKASVQQFIMKSIVAGVTILLIYYLTIATFITRTVSFMDKVEPVLVVSEKAGLVLNQDYIAEQVKILANQLLNGCPYTHGLIHCYEKFADSMENISGENKNRLRESTRKILNNLSPVFDGTKSSQ
tara:strand:- start:98 stop:496 length:399 start_codon:yes stop_codon:yes gene_type:complete